MTNKFSGQYKATVGMDFATKDVTVDSTVVTLQLWDTAGQDRFKSSLGSAYYRGSDGVVLVYDVSDMASFQAMDSWREEFLKNANLPDGGADFPFIVLGNKSDLDPSKHVVPQQLVKQWCESKGGIPHFLVSALTGAMIDDAFMRLAVEASRRSKEEHEPIIPDTLKLSAAPAPKESGCSC